MVLWYILALVIWGLAAGGLARFALPGPDPMSLLATFALGLTGSLLGGVVSEILIGRAGGLVFSVLGAVLLLYLYRRFVQRRPLTGPGARRQPPQ
ncbi:MAG TPA: GlsB/YeaQ/YmgE family stress response membrane protein [Gaiellaceae bacterium]